MATKKSKGLTDREKHFLGYMTKGIKFSSDELKRNDTAAVQSLIDQGLVEEKSTAMGRAFSLIEDKRGDADKLLA